MKRALREHWPEYLMEAALLGIFMVLATAYTVALEYPGSPLRVAIVSATLRRAIMGVLIGCTAYALIVSPWGKQSGAHFNPATTLTFLHLGKIGGWDALFYVVAQFVGAVLGTVLIRALVGAPVAHPTVAYIVTAPGAWGALAAFVGEVAIAFGLITVVLTLSNHPTLHTWTPVVVGALVGTYIVVEAPLSGMSLNPARSFAPALVAHSWHWLWIYFSAPPLGMLLAARGYVALAGRERIHCAKFHHANDARCVVFHCRFGELVTNGAR